MHKLLATLVVSLLLAACGGGGGGGSADSPATATGALKLNVNGLPSGTPAAITVSGAGSSHAVSASTTLGALTPGNYTVNASPVTGYTPQTAQQTVTITANATQELAVNYMQPTPPADAEAPQIRLLGANPVSVNLGQSYADAVDGDLSAALVATSTVNTAQAGSYEVRYTVSDRSGNAATPAVRVVHVLASATGFRLFGPDNFITIKSGSGGFTAPLDTADRFSRDHDKLGDLDHDGITDLVVGARSDDDGATDAGAVYILFMKTDGTVKNHQKISMLAGGFGETLLEGNFFGYGVAGIGDYDGDGNPDIAVSSPVPPNRAVYVLFLNRNGTVKSWVKNSAITAMGLSALGDLNGDGRIDLAACDPDSSDGGPDRGALRLLFLRSDGSVDNTKTVTLSSTQGGLGDVLKDGDGFGGREAASLGDLDGDGHPELAVGSFTADAGRGAIWLLSLDKTSLQVRDKRRIASGESGFDEILSSDPNPNGTEGAHFGHALVAAGDLNQDGIADLVTGANQFNEGYAYILYLNRDKSVKTYTRINNAEGGFGLVLDPVERYSRSISFLGDLRKDGSLAVAIGGGAGGTGTLYLMFFKPCTQSRHEAAARWNGGNTLYSNWDAQQGKVSTPLSYEQCALKSFERKAPHISHDASLGRCELSDGTSQLLSAPAGNTAYVNQCF